MGNIINESEEMYLESIYVLSKGGKPVRNIDIAIYLGHAKPSVTYGLRNLAEKGYIEYNPNKSIKLTQEGLKKALSVYERHVVLKEILMYLGADEKLAEEDGCKIEHVVSDELLHVLEEFLKKTHKNLNQ